MHASYVLRYGIHVHAAELTLQQTNSGIGCKPRVRPQDRFSPLQSLLCTEHLCHCTVCSSGHSSSGHLSCRLKTIKTLRKISQNMQNCRIGVIDSGGAPSAQVDSPAVGETLAGD